MLNIEFRLTQAKLVEIYAEVAAQEAGNIPLDDSKTENVWIIKLHFVTECL